MRHRQKNLQRESLIALDDALDCEGFFPLSRPTLASTKAFSFFRYRFSALRYRFSSLTFSSSFYSSVSGFFGFLPAFFLFIGVLPRFEHSKPSRPDSLCLFSHEQRVPQRIPSPEDRLLQLISPSGIGFMAASFSFALKGRLEPCSMPLKPSASSLPARKRTIDANLSFWRFVTNSSGYSYLWSSR